MRSRGEEEGEGEDVHQKEVLCPTVEELSEWHSPPPQRPSMQTQTDPARRQRKGGKKKNRVRKLKVLKFM